VVGGREVGVDDLETAAAGPDGLAGSIAEFREDLDRLIDEQKALVLRLGSSARPAREPASRTPRPPLKPRDADVLTPEIDDEPGPADDARQRLDALARLLDRRSKQTAPAAGVEP